MKRRTFAGKILSLTMAAVMTALLFATSSAEEAVTVESSSYDRANRQCEVTFRINDTALDDVVVDVGETVSNLLFASGDPTSMPSDKITVKVNIKNESSHGFRYGDSGLNLGVLPAPADEPPTDFVDADGNHISLYRIGNMMFDNPAMKALMGKTIYSGDFDTVLTTYSKLADMGYTGDDALSDYFLDYYRDAKSRPGMTWEELTRDYRDELISSFTHGEYLFKVPNDLLDELDKTPLTDYAIGAGGYNGGMWILQKWPDRRLAQLSIDIFYENLLTAVFGTDSVPSDEIRQFGIGMYQDKTSPAYTKANSYLASSIGTDGVISSHEEGSFTFHVALEGMGTGNIYASYYYSNFMDMKLEFVRTDIAVTARKVWKLDDGREAAENVKVTLLENGTVTDTQTLSASNNWEYVWTGLDDRSQWTVEEKDVPEGFTANVSRDGNVFTITNDDMPLPAQPDIPNTGDTSAMTLWITLASLCAVIICFIAFAKKRKS